MTINTDGIDKTLFGTDSVSCNLRETDHTDQTGKCKQTETECDNKDYNRS